MPGVNSNPEPVILAVRPQSLTEKDRAALRRAGVVVIEHDDPAELRLLRPRADLDGGDMLRCALEALAHGDSTGYVRANRELFVKLLAAAVTAQESRTTAKDG